MYDNRNGVEELYRQEQPLAVEKRVAGYLARVMGWMCVGLLTTFVAAMLCLASPSLMTFFFSTNAIYAVFLLELGVAAAMSLAVNKVGPGVATVMFMVYAALTGITFSALFLLFEMSSLVTVFGITSLIFIGMSVYGSVTKRDLTRIGTLAMFGLFGVIIAGVVNLFLGNTVVHFITTCVGIVIFIALIAYDTQKIKNIYLSATERGYDEDGPELRKMSIYGALTLYLDFINLFLKLLTLLGKRRR